MGGRESQVRVEGRAAQRGIGEGAAKLSGVDPTWSFSSLKRRMASTIPPSRPDRAYDSTTEYRRPSRPLSTGQDNRRNNSIPIPHQQQQQQVQVQDDLPGGEKRDWKADESASELQTATHAPSRPTADTPSPLCSATTLWSNYTRSGELQATRHYSSSSLILVHPSWNGKRATRATGASSLHQEQMVQGQQWEGWEARATSSTHLVSCVEECSRESLQLSRRLLRDEQPSSRGAGSLLAL